MKLIKSATNGRYGKTLCKYEIIIKTFEGQVNIRITDGHNLLTDYEYNYFGTIETESDLNRIGRAYNQYTGSLIKKQIVLKEFVNQP